MNWCFWKKEPTPAHLRTGVWGEKLAARMLKKKGYRVLGRRVRIGRHDEIDLVARDGETLVFVEVKTRASEWFGRPVAAVNRDKIHRLSRAASRYIKRLKKKPRFMRFDVVEVVGTPANGVPPEIRHIESAFTMSRSFHLQW